MSEKYVERFYFWPQVETYGSMERDEKVHFIIEQVRLCLAKKDYIRAQIISKKISTKFFFNESDAVQVTRGSCSACLVDMGMMCGSVWCDHAAV